MINQQGMTLIEVMVAMAILAMAGLALLKTNHEQVRNLNYLEQKQFASWVADNQLTLMRLQPATTSQQQGEVSMAGQKWYWRSHAVPTNQPEVNAIEVEVRARADDPTALVRLYSWRLRQ